MMNKNYKLNLKSILIGGALIIGGVLSAQVQLNQLSDFGTPIYDINISGKGVHGSGYYDFQTNLSSLSEDGVGETTNILNDETVLGKIESNGNFIPAVRIDGVWAELSTEAFNPNTDYTLHEMSQNGQWVVGQTAWDPDANTAWGFIYNVQDEVLNILESDLYEFGAAYGVNDNGYAVGWVDDLDAGTLRMPAVFAPDGEIILVGEDVGAMSGINNMGIAVGDFLGQAIVYDVVNDSYESFAAPGGAFFATFTDISENGVVIGYAEYPGFIRKPIVYHPDLGAEPMLLEDLLANFGVDASTLNGTAYSISTDGNYISGFSDGPAFLAMGWAVYFDDKLFEESDCTLICPSNIEVTAEMGESSVVVEYDITYECIDGENDDLEIVLVSGLPSGSEFPFGETLVYHELRDADGNVLNSCSFKVIVNDLYCTTEFNGLVEPITSVKFVEIDNQTAADSTIKNEYFLDMVANVNQGETYPISVEGVTGGGYVNYVNVFIDWNQDGVFDLETEVYNVGALFASTGEDGQEVTADIQVPYDALIGQTRMRVVKNYGVNPIDACATDYLYGQTEDYSIMVGEGIEPGVNDCDKIYAGNQFENGLGPVQTYIFANDFEVNAGEMFTVNEVKLNLWIDPTATITSADIYVYHDSDSGEGPGDTIYENYGLAPTSIKNIGGNLGYITYEVTFDLGEVELTAEGSENVVYWLAAQVYSDNSDVTVYWDANSTLNSQNQQYIFDADESTWVTNYSVFEYEADGVMSIIGECENLSVMDLNGFDFTYYPNPTRDVLNINSQKFVRTVEVFNLAGQKVMNSTNLANDQVDVSKLSAGVYVFKVTLDGGQVETFKIVKK